MSSQLSFDLCSIPAGPVPVGITPNFIDPPTFQVGTLVIGSVLTAISTILVAGRLCNTWDHMRASDCQFTHFHLLVSS